MTATYNSPVVTAKTPAATHGSAGNLKAAYAKVTCTAAPTTADTLNFFDLPAGARIVGAALKASDMDTSTSPGITIDIGWAGSADALFAASTVAQAGTDSTSVVVAARDQLLTSQTRVTGTAHANATTGAAGSVELTVNYLVEGQAD